MRRSAIACAMLVAALALLLARDRVVRGHGAPPRAESSEPGTGLARGDRSADRNGEATDNEVVEASTVEIRAGGVILFQGARVSLASLGRTCAKRKVVDVRVEDAVSWAHVEWVLAKLEDAGVRRIRFDLPDGTVETCFESDYWKQEVRHLVGGHNAGVIMVGLEDLDDPDLECRVVDEAVRIEGEFHLKPVGGPFLGFWPPEWPTFGRMARGLRALRDAGVEIELRFVWPENATAEGTTLPPPSDPPMSLSCEWHRCSCGPGLVALDLPIADMGEFDSGQEQDDRLVIQLDRDGRVLARTERTLDQLAQVLRVARDRYELKMRQQGKTGIEKVPDGPALSKVYVLIRADRETPARHVGWILHVLDEQDFYKVQFAVTRGEEDPGPCVGDLDCKIQVFLPGDGGPGITCRDEPTVHVYVDSRSYGVGSVGGLDAEELEPRVRAQWDAVRADPSAKSLVAVHVAPGIPWGRVITAVNEIARAGIERVDFHDLPPPDEATRRMNPLPR